ncbi:MAG TPA: hypothetical protein VFG04_04535 [Planctomycetaceae bacterium]|jgi:hypothetical protein|nr:hypothetical protein [Planctomycetaceae bacterium]
MGSLWFYIEALFLVCAALVLMYLLYLAGRSSRSLVRARRCRSFAEMAAKRSKEGNVTEAVGLYLKAESAWALNRWDGGRDSWLRDLDLLATIGSGLVRSVGREPGTAFVDFNATIREMREVLKERGNFGVDGRRILPEVMIRWKASMDRLDGYRAQLREVCQPRNIRRI